MPFSHLQNALQLWMPRVLNHPFNQKLANGSLPVSVFNAFLKQDKLYLQAYANTLSTIAHRLQNSHPIHASAFDALSQDARNTENHLHQKYLKKTHPSYFFKSPPPSKSSAINTYIQHLHETTQTKPIPIAIAAVLPCFLIYRELGTNMPLDPKHRFYDWIKTYSSSGFLENTEKMITVFNAHHQVNLQNEILENFIKSIQHEINFWDSIIKPPCIKTLPNRCAGR